MTGWSGREHEANISRNGDDNHDLGSGRRRTVPTTRECNYSDFLKYQPLNFKGTEGVIGLTQWFKKMESVFYISNCTNLKVKGTDVVSYTQLFQDLALMCGRMSPEVSDEVEKYVGGLPDMIQGSVMASKPKTMQDAIEFPNDLMDQKIRTFVERQVENKRKIDDNSRNNHIQQQPHKRQNVSRAYIVGPGDYKKDYAKLKNKNHGNQARNGGAPARAYAVGNVGSNLNTNVITDHDYDVELADEKIIRVNTIIRGYTLNFLNHPFNIDLMPVELGSFDVIIGMDWLLSKEDMAYQRLDFTRKRACSIPNTAYPAYNIRRIQLVKESKIPHQIWRMCVDFTDLNKACPQNCYPLPEIDWKVESLCGYPFKCFLDAYKGYHQIQLAEPDEEKTAFHTRQGYDLVVKNYTEAEMMRDINETFHTLRKVNMKLNPKKCSFGLAEGVFLGKVSAAISDLKKVHYKERLSLDRGGRTSLPAVEAAPIRITPIGSGTKLISDGKIGFVTSLRGKRLRRYFQAHPITVITDKPIKQVMYHPDMAGRLQKWSIMLREHNITYMPITSVKGQILAYFLIEMPGEDSQAVPATKTQEELYTLFTDGSSCMDGSGAGLVLTSPAGVEFTYALRFQFTASNNEADYEALVAGLRIAARMGVKDVHVSVDSKLVANQVLGTYVAKEDNMVKYLEIVKSLVLVEVLKDKSIKEEEVTTVIEEYGPTWMTQLADYLKGGVLPRDKKEARKLCLKARQYELMNGVLYRRSFLTPWLRCVGPLQVEYVMRKIYKGSCSMHVGPRSVVAKAIRLGYYWLTMHKDVRDMIQKCSDSGPFPEGPGKVKFLIVAMDYFTKWIEAKAVAIITGGQSNGLVKRANQSMGEGIKSRLGEGNKNWNEELSHVLWAHRTMIKSSHGDMPFSLTYGTEAVIPTEIGMPTYRTIAVDVVSNDEELRLNLNLLEERRKRAAICEAKAKSKMTKYYNARVRGVTFKPGDFVYRSNDASHAVAGGKLGPKWEGPYEVTEALGNEACKLRSMDETNLPRTWNIVNLKRCYL
nr:hypothetical protein [Tanacetum cinerariifolium]